jgi:hypothetical protein
VITIVVIIVFINGVVLGWSLAVIATAKRSDAAMERMEDGL